MYLSANLVCNYVVDIDKQSSLVKIQHYLTGILVANFHGPNWGDYSFSCLISLNFCNKYIHRASVFTLISIFSFELIFAFYFQDSQG